MTEQVQSNAKWYQKNGGIIALLIIFWPVGLYLMWQHSNWSKAAKWVVTGFFAFCMLIFLTADTDVPPAETPKQVQQVADEVAPIVQEPEVAEPTPAEPTTSNTNQEPPVVEAAPAQEPKAEEPVEEVVEQEVVAQSTQDKLWIALDNGIKTRTGYSIEWNESSGTAKVTKSGDTYWDENDAVRGVYSDIVKFGLEAFKLEEVKQIQVIHESEFTDTYGKSETEALGEIWFDKAEFQKYDWNNLSFQPISLQMKESSSYYYVHPAAAKNLDASKLYLAI